MRRGVVFDLAHVLHADIPAFPGRTFRQYLTTNYHQINRRRPDAGPAGWGRNNVNWIVEQVTATQQMGTHMDALNHLQVGDRTYNGYRLADIAEDHGTNQLGVDTLPQIVTRGVLVDVAARARRAPSRPGDVITVDDVEDALARPVDVQPGDAVLFHTGWGSLWGVGQRPVRRRRAGPGHGRRPGGWSSSGVALTGCDTWSYGPVPAEDPAEPFVVPQTLNIHHGVVVVENLRLAEIAREPASPSSCSSSRTPSCAAPPARGSPAGHRLSLRSTAMTDHYDVIVIGSGAGGGTADPRARAHRREGPAARTRRLAAPRGGELEPGCGLGRRPLPQLRQLDRPGRQGVHARSSTTTSAATPRSTARSCSGSASGTSARSSTSTASRRRGRSATPTSNPGTPGPSSSTRCTASAASTRPSRRPRSPTRIPAISHEPRIAQLQQRPAPAPGCNPFPLPNGILIDESAPQRSACMRCATCDGFPCLVNGKADAQVICVEPALRYPNVTLLTNALVTRLETDPSGRTVNRRRRRARRRGGDATPPTSSSWPAARSTPRRCCCAPPATSIPTAWATRSGVVGPAPDAAQQLVADRLLQDAQPDEVPEDAGHQRLLLRRPRATGPTRSARCRCSARATPC